jgi:hypothetical protein
MSLNQYANMVGLFVASNAVNMLLSYASSQKNDSIAKTVAPYIDNTFKFLNRLDSNSKLQAWEKHIDQTLQDIKTQITTNLSPPKSTSKAK